MARVTVEDCIDKVDSPYELVLVAKERATQLNSGLEPSIERDNDKNTVISLREIGEGKVSIKNLEDSAINKLRIQKEETVQPEDINDEKGDDFEKIYKGEISKSGTSILPSKRVRRITEKNIFRSVDPSNKDESKKISEEKLIKSVSSDSEKQE